MHKPKEKNIHITFDFTNNRKEDNRFLMSAPYFMAFYQDGKQQEHVYARFEKSVTTYIKNRKIPCFHYSRQGNITQASMRNDNI